MDLCELTETAYLEYMKNHPLPQVKLNLTQDLKAALNALTDVEEIDRRITNKQHKERIRARIAFIRKLQIENMRGDRDQAIAAQREMLLKNVQKALKAKHTDDELVQLLREAEELL